MIMLQAIACNHRVEPVKNGTALTSTKATPRAQAYSAMLRTSFAVLKAAAIENPRLITALTAVISAQKRNGMLIQDAKGVDAPSQDTAASDYQVENSVATSDVGTLEHPAMCARLRSRLSPARGYVRPGSLHHAFPCRLHASVRTAFRTGKREMINVSQLI